MKIGNVSRMAWAVAAVGLGAGVNAQTVWYVDDDAPGGDGTSWETASSDLALTLEDAAATPGNDEVRVAAGVYKPAAGASFVVSGGVTVKGGYAGVGDVWDPAVQVTTLSGDVNGNDEPGFVNRGDNAEHVVVITAGNVVTLDGLTIMGGNASGAGGGVYISGGAYVPGGPDVLGANPVMDGCVLRDNSGGAVYAGGGSPLFRGCTFDGNVSAPAGSGGAIFSVAGVTIESCEFVGNRAYRDGGAVYAFSSAKITDTLFEENKGDQAEQGYRGGAIFRGGGVPADFTVDSCEFRGNSAHEGGAIRFFNQNPGLSEPFLISGTTFYGNTANSFGGGVCDLPDGMTMYRCILSGNSAATAGGAITTNTGSARIINCTIADNFSLGVAGVGGGVCLTANPSTPTVSSSILWGNTDSSGMTESAQIGRHGVPSLPIVSYSCVQGLTTFVDPPDTDPPVLGNIGSNPAFFEPSPPNYSLTFGSLCIDTGDPDPMYYDLDDSRNDMGAIPSTGNAEPVAVVDFEQLTDIGQTARVRLDGQGSSDADDSLENLTFQWWVDATVVWVGPGSEFAVVEVLIGYGEHVVTLRVADPDGAYHEDTKVITIDPSSLALLQVGKSTVDFKAGTFSVSGEVGLPYGVDYTEVTPTVAAAVSVVEVEAGSAPLSLSASGSQWVFSNPAGVGGITNVSIDWKGARFEYSASGLTLRTVLITSGETVLTVKYQMKRIGAPFMLTIDDRATLTVDAQGVAAADVPLTVDDPGREITLTLPFAITDDTVIAVMGPPFAIIYAGDYMRASIGRFLVEGKFNSAAYPAGAATTPRTVDLGLVFGNEGYAGEAQVGPADLAVKKDKWQAR